ncbi:putative ATP binding protein SugR [Halalkalibacter akibai JCM 9157]|uniref:Putative ATP binding protein SugR n=1 Tax=Halalkalibacter akibai (strain ATCC 43226 / DSM 21942 / CIP 109018 / JCM 9157 / 1139) TaxID=1236973 RepID=W4R1U3_HALA3|nr:putative ATP binding protein SugR [Halalkalibacter akibai JCM 9157]
MPERGYPDHFYEYFSNNNFTILVGENGNGKTTLMSFVANIFHNLQRYHDRIKSDFTLRYIIERNNELYKVNIEKEERNLFIFVEGFLSKSLILELHPQRGYVVKAHQKHITNNVTYEEIKKFLPSRIITSVFSLHGEYPVDRQPNFIGDRIVDSYDISKIYGSNHYEFKSLSKGIYRFLETYKNNSDIVDELLNFLSFKFINKLLVRKRLETYPHHELFFASQEDQDEDYFTDEDKAMIQQYKELENLIKEYAIDDNGWVEVSEDNYEDFFKFEQNELIYMNDLAFEKDGEFIALENMSSGEKMFFIRILSLLSSIEDNALIIIEEPELHLNPSWTKQIITMLQMLFSKFKVHFLISTHSYSFINTVFPENILFANEKKFMNPDPTINTFLANEVEISNMFFANSKRANYVEDILWKKVKNASGKELEEIIDYLGESYTKFKLFNILLKKQGNNTDVEN